MPIQIIPERREPSRGEKLAGGASNIAQAFAQYMGVQKQKEMQSQENEALKKSFGIDLSGIQNPDERKAIISEMLKSRGKEQEFEREKGFLQQLFGDKSPKQQERIQSISEKDQFQDMGISQEIPQNLDVSQIPDEAIAIASAIKPQLGNALQRMKDVSLREQRETEKAETKKFESERAYHTQFSKDVEKEADALRMSIPRLEMALDFSRDAIQTGNIGYFSPDKLADITGVDLFRTAKGAQLITAGKENLFGNMSRVSARAQNLWFEQRLNSMFPKIGQSQEANLTTQEIIEGEVALNKAYLNELDRLSEQDEKEHGFVKKDVKRRALSSMIPKEKEILARTSYRMKEIEEKEKGLSRMKKQVGKNVTKGTSLTLAMAKLYKEKFGDNALQVAKKNGYSIPTIEDFKIYQKIPREFREELSE